MFLRAPFLLLVGSWLLVVRTLNMSSTVLTNVQVYSTVLFTRDTSHTADLYTYSPMLSKEKLFLASYYRLFQTYTKEHN